MEERKRIEQRRYDQQAAPLLERELDLEPGAAGIPPEFRAPYADFEKRIASVAGAGAVVLDLGAGTGVFSLSARGGGRFLIATDISETALQVARRRAATAGVPLSLVCADGERLPFRNGSVDVVTAAGALYCFELDSLAAEVRRVLRPSGAWVIVDSLNNNPLYRLNRWVGFLRRRRTALAVRNVPTVAAIQTLSKGFRTVGVAYHGVLTFLLPLLRPALGAESAGHFVSAADRWLRWLQHWAFKVVVVAEHPR